MAIADLVAHLLGLLSQGHDDRRSPFELIETHASLVLLGEQEVFKFKKAVDFGFLDYSSPAKRQFYCEQEIALNRELAPEVYLAIVPIVMTADHSPRFAIEESYQPPQRGHWLFSPVFAGPRPAHWLEVCVHMRRLSHQKCLHAQIVENHWPFTLPSQARDAWSDQTLSDRVEQLGRMIAAFHQKHLARADQRHYASAIEVRTACLENFNTLESCTNLDLNRQWLAEIREAHERALLALDFDRRAQSPAIVATHGDLRLDHVYVQEAGDGTSQVLVVDCVEFNPRFAINDGVADVAFFAMELIRHDREALAQTFLQAYFADRGDSEGPAFVATYLAYRALVRAKVEALRADQSGLDSLARERAIDEVWAHLQVAARTLNVTSQSGGLIMLGGLPGTGKSTLASALLDELSPHKKVKWIRADDVRLEMKEQWSDAEITPSGEDASFIDRGVYSPERRDQVYQRCSALAKQALFRGELVLVDATFAAIKQRQTFSKLAHDLALPWGFVECKLAPQQALARLKARKGGPSQADESVYLAMTQSWPTASWRDGDALRLHSRCLDVDTQESVAMQVKRVRERFTWL